MDELVEEDEAFYNDVLNIVIPLIPTFYMIGKDDFIYSLYQLTYNHMTNYNYFTNMNYKMAEDFTRNLKEFALGKTYNISQKLAVMDSVTPDKVVLESNTKTFLKKKYLNEQRFEDNAVSKTTRYSKEMQTTKDQGRLLIYVSERDSKVRPTHNKADGIVGRYNDKFFTLTAPRLLSEWGCRCSVEPADDYDGTEWSDDTIKIIRKSFLKDEQIRRSKGYKDINATNSAGMIVNIDDNRIQSFSESNPYIKGTPKIIRKRYAK